MTLTTLYNLADQQSQKVKVSEVALRATNRRVGSGQIGFAAECGFEPSRQLYGQCLSCCRGFSANGTTDYIVPGVEVIPVANGKQDTSLGEAVYGQVAQVVYAGGAIRSGIRMAELGKEMAEV